MTLNPPVFIYTGEHAAKLLGLKSARELYKKLRGLQVLNDRNQPNPGYTSWGIVQLKTDSFTLPGHNNLAKVYSKPMFSPRGIEFIRGLLKKNQERVA